MSLTSFLDMAEVKLRVKPLRPKLPRKINASLKVAPRSNRYMMVGTAFDYLLRFELQRRAPYAISERLVAEDASGMMCGPAWFMHLSPDSTSMPPEEEEEATRDMANRVGNVVEKAKAAIATYLTIQESGSSTQADLAGHAIRLAKVDEFCRAGQLNPTFEDADPEDVEDLLGLLAIVPFDALIHPQIMLLNPTFEEASLLVGGADTDLVTGDMLVEFKTTKASEMQAGDLDQLLGYYLLARHNRRSNPAFPVINRLAIYFCRHGLLWVQSATTWTEHPQFSETEEWFFERAKGVFRSSRQDR
jgi:hypothetical protein